MSAPASKRRIGRQLVRQTPFFIWLVVVWMAAWGQLTWLAFISGAIVALIVLRVFYLPPAETPGRFNLYRFVILVGVFVGNLVQSSFQVAWQALRPRPVGASSIIQVDLRTESDLILTLTAEAVTLVPGSFVTEVDREATTLYLHVLGAGSRKDVEAMRQRVLAQEERFILALGSAEDVARLRRWHEHDADREREDRTPVQPRTNPNGKERE